MNVSPPRPRSRDSKRLDEALGSAPQRRTPLLRSCSSGATGLLLRLALALVASSCAEVKTAPVPASEGDTRPQPPSEGLRFGFTPAHGARDASSNGQRLARYLAARAQVAFRPFVASSYGTLVKGVSEGWVDVGWLPPFVYAMARKGGDVRPLARFVRQGQASYRSAFIVRDQSPIRTLAQLRGKRMAYTDPRSSAGYLAPRGHLQALGLDADHFFSNQSFLGSHKRVVEAVLDGRADVGVTFYSSQRGPDGGLLIGASAWQQHAPARAREIRVLAETAPIPSDVIAVRARCPEALALRIRDAFLRMHESPEGRELLMGIFNAERALATDASDYASVERWVPGYQPVAAPPPARGQR